MYALPKEICDRFWCLRMEFYKLNAQRLREKEIQ